MFIDYLSANRSKRWAPMHSVQAQASGLPHTEKSRIQNEFGFKPVGWLHLH